MIKRALILMAVCQCVGQAFAAPTTTSEVHGVSPGMTKAEIASHIDNLQCQSENEDGVVNCQVDSHDEYQFLFTNHMRPERVFEITHSYCSSSPEEEAVKELKEAYRPAAQLPPLEMVFKGELASKILIELDRGTPCYNVGPNINRYIVNLVDNNLFEADEAAKDGKQ